MKLKRFLKSLINNILFIVNAILWIFNMKSLGEMATRIQVGDVKNKKQRLMYGMFSFLQYFSYICIIGLVYTIMWLVKNETSIAEKLSGLKAEEVAKPVAPAASQTPVTPTPAASTNETNPSSPSSTNNPQ